MLAIVAVTLVVEGVVEGVVVLQHALGDAIEMVGLFLASELVAAALIVESIAVLQ